MKIIKLWKPSFKLSLLPNKSIPIRFKKSQEDFHYFEKPNLEEGAVREFLSKKIVLVGYLGPSSEDKHYTPLRSKIKFQGTGPDSDGIVINANAIRTLLDYYVRPVSSHGITSSLIIIDARHRATIWNSLSGLLILFQDECPPNLFKEIK